jgi:hypothetical protein
MVNVGFCGGSTMRELGSASDMKAFFNCIRLTAPHLARGGDDGLLTDRLYRRYLRSEELDQASAVAQETHDTMTGMPSNSIDWPSLGWISTATRLDISQKTAADVFAKYFKDIQYLSECAKSFEIRFKIYRPVMTIISDLPRLHIDEMRPLVEYDSLEGEPIWLRP